MLVLCHGNVCRSPLAAAVLRGVLGPDRVRDCGVGCTPGRLAAKKTRVYAEAHAPKYATSWLLDHRSQPLTVEVLAWADVVLYMDPGNLRRLKAFCGAEGVTPARVKCLADWAPGRPDRIPDPNYLRTGSDECAAVFGLVVAAAEAAGLSLLRERGLA